ncbi:hypothetical protein [Vibrio owensii]|uniref:hypothetical protein n=1 Tax=Vibrio owensii TaxID=696485 RepID=UPI003CC54110
MEIVTVDLTHPHSGKTVSVSCPAYPGECTYIEFSADHWESSAKLDGESCRDGGSEAIKQFVAKLGLEYDDDELVLLCHNNESLMRICQNGEHIRFTKDGTEEVLWDSVEFEEDPFGVLGAIVGKAFSDS